MEEIAASSKRRLSGVSIKLLVITTAFLLVAALAVAVCPAGVRWTENGVQLTSGNVSHKGPGIVPDGAGGAIIAWYEESGIFSDVYVQRVNSSGVEKWAPGGVLIRSSTAFSPGIVQDGSGGAIIAWWDKRGGASDIYAQRVNSSGETQWTDGGVAICTQADAQQTPRIISDGSGGAIIYWQDYRNGASDIYAQKVSPDGVVQWAADGVAVCTAGNDQDWCFAASDQAGGAIFTWEDERSGVNDIYAQRVNSSGACQWTAGGVLVCDYAQHTWHDQMSPHIVSDYSGGAIIAWYDARWGGSQIYAQRVNGDGGIPWVADGVQVCSATGSGYVPRPKLATDNEHGAITTWHVNNPGGADVYAHRVTDEGILPWSSQVALCEYSGEQLSPVIVADGVGGAVVAWQDERSGNRDIYAQKVNSLGEVQWAGDGIAVVAASYNQDGVAIAHDGLTGAILAWQDLRAGDGYTQIYSQRVTDDAPQVISINPTSGPIGTLVTIDGSNFGSYIPGISSVCFNGVAANPVSWDDGEIKAQVPAGASTGAVSVNTAGGTDVGPTFNVTTPATLPTITSISPAAYGAVGDTVTINGSNFGAVRGSSYVEFNGAKEPVAQTPEKPRIISPPEAGNLLVLLKQ